MITYWSNEFALIIPQKSGVTWQHQTDGVCCNQIYIEGIMIPLIPNNEELLNKLTTANYNYDKIKVKQIWKEIDKSLEFEYKQIVAPEGWARTQEGLKWIQIIKIKYPKKKNERVDKILYERDCKEIDDKYKDLLGKVIALIYPNCD